MSDNTTAVPTLTPAQKRKATRERKKAELMAAVNHRQELFESMSEEDMNAMCEQLEAIKDSYREQMEAHEEMLQDEAREQLKAVIEKYSWDVAKSYTEEYFNGRETVPCFLDLDHMIDEFEEVEDNGVQLPTQADIDTLKSLRAETEPYQTAMQRDMLATLKARKAVEVPTIQTVEPEAQPIPSKPNLQVPANFSTTLTCGTCQRPWINGKCSGGFINHKL